MNKKAFLLIDSLVCLIITVSVSCICLFTCQKLDKQDEIYKMYYENTNDKYKGIYKSLPECVKCQIEIEDIEEDF